LTTLSSATAIFHHFALLVIFTPNPMKRTRRRLPVPQHEFGFTPDTFNLIQELGIDGERITRERAEADNARRIALEAQTALFSTTRKKP
jgi:hypothetical protein